MTPEPKNWDVYSLRTWKEILQPSIEKLGEEKVIGAISHAIIQAAKFHAIEMRFNETTLTLQVRRPESRADRIQNPIECLTPHEKERLGFLISWVLNGPEHGCCRNSDIVEMKVELDEFCKNNHIPLFYGPV